MGSHYSVKLPSPILLGAISDDADFLGNKEDLTAIAKAVGGVPEFTSSRFVSALVGQVKIRITPLEFVNVDVLHKLVGLDAAVVRQRAATATLGATEFRVMHPIDVFQSRIENLAQLHNKQTPEGIEQAKLAVLVADQFVREVAETGDEGQRHASKIIEHIVSIAKSGAGRKAAREFGVDFRGALPGYAIKSDKFRQIRWPQILTEVAHAHATAH